MQARSDRAILGVLAAEMLGELDDENEHPPNVEILTAMVVVEVVNMETGATRIGFKCSDHRPWFQAAFLDQAAEVAREPDLEED